MRIHNIKSRENNRLAKSSKLIPIPIHPNRRSFSANKEKKLIIEIINSKRSSILTENSSMMNKSRIKTGSMTNSNSDIRNFIPNNKLMKSTDRSKLSLKD